jgi:hypothetical protein
MFPRAKFVHLVRDPYAVVPSTLRLWQSLESVQGLQHPRFEHLVEYVFDAFQRVYRGFEAAQHLLDRNQICTVRYEQLVQDPVTEVARVYEELELGGFDAVRSRLQQYARSAKQYQANRLTLPPRLRQEISRRCAAFIEKYEYASGEEHAPESEAATNQ